MERVNRSYIVNVRINKMIYGIKKFSIAFYLFPLSSSLNDVSSIIFYFLPLFSPLSFQSQNSIKCSLQVPIYPQWSFLQLPIYIYTIYTVYCLAIYLSLFSNSISVLTAQYLYRYSVFSSYLISISYSLSYLVSSSLFILTLWLFVLCLLQLPINWHIHFAASSLYSLSSSLSVYFHSLAC